MHLGYFAAYLKSVVQIKVSSAYLYFLLESTMEEKNANQQLCLFNDVIYLFVVKDI